MRTGNNQTERRQQLSPGKLEEELQAYQRSGCVLKLNGKVSNPGRVVSACVREHGSYMRDILLTTDNQVREINFIRVRDR